MKLSTLQGWYRAHAATGDAASAESAIGILRDSDHSAARDAAIEQLLASEAGAASLRVAAAVQADAAEAGVALAQADWRERRDSRRSPRAAPIWLPYALAAGIAVLVLGVTELHRQPVSVPSPLAATPIVPAAPAPSTPAARPALAPGDLIFNGKLDEEPVAANSHAKRDVLFRDDLGG